ncbi:hypothetical protein NDU88_004207 [Pleurodeles waltl]|uniref:Uncharacterized protein n=1 Tax=Pleurodeles waltl TaxID=8319 RepID=A0AAV7MDD0_PLEWA|nr:hypothetical protein NDU88_004207 [Pleurodeles waltl]
MTCAVSLVSVLASQRNSPLQPTPEAPLPHCTARGTRLAPVMRPASRASATPGASPALHLPFCLLGRTAPVGPSQARAVSMVEGRGRFPQLWHLSSPWVLLLADTSPCVGVSYRITLWCCGAPQATTRRVATSFCLVSLNSG